MTRFALLVQVTPFIEDGNYLRFTRELLAHGHAVDILDIDSLLLRAGRICASGFNASMPLNEGEPFPAGTEIDIDHDVAWVLGLGNRTTFLDKFQMLYALPETTRVINSLDALMHLKSKYFLAAGSNDFPNPETHASTSASDLVDIVQASGGRWVVKPPAGSLGVDVHFTHADDPELERIVTSLCGPDNTRYTLLQRYVPEIESGEKRVLLAGGEIIGQYLRIANPGEQTNVNQGACTVACELTREETDLCGRLAKQLFERGALFSGIDLAWPWLIEVNVINPGGLTTISELGGEDLASKVIRAVTRAL